MFRIGKRRAVAAGFGAALLISGVMVLGANVASGTGTTNGDPVTFGQVQCQASVGAIHLTQAQDITVQAVVPNQVDQGASYSVTIPGGTAMLPTTGSGLPISGYKNLAQTYEFISDAGTATVTDAQTNPPGAGAVSAGNPVAFNVTHNSTSVTLNTPVASPGALTTPDVTVTITAPSADATVTTFVTEVDTTATLSLGDASVVCAIPHVNPQTDGISATLVGAGGATTSSEASCRPVGPNACATTTTTVKQTTTTSIGGSTTTTSIPSGPTISISDASVIRPDKGTAKAIFTATISSAPAKKATVKFETADDTAMAPTDYKHKKGSISFTPTSLSKTITVNVVGGKIGQPDKMFFVNLSSPVGASILDGQGVGTIIDKHTPGVSIADATIARPTRSTPLVFTLTLTKPSVKGMVCKVLYMTEDLTAHNKVDYKAKHGTVTFKPGTSTGKLSVTVRPSSTTGDVVFIVQLANPSNCQIVDGLAAGTITG